MGHPDTVGPLRGASEDMRVIRRRGGEGLDDNRCAVACKQK